MSTRRFGPQSLPYGVFSTPGQGPRIGVRLGDEVLDLSTATSTQDGEWAALAAAPSLDPVLAAGSEAWSGLRELARRAATGRATGVERHPIGDVAMHLPFTVSDYVDFYASSHHAANVGRIFRGSADLPRAWRYLPIGYHGRASSVRVSGEALQRPQGLRIVGDTDVPEFGPTHKLDLECELGFVIGGCSGGVTRVSVDDAERYVFGVVILNDWSARDIQAYEYVPLGPMLGKSFATSISAWVLPWAALDEARCDLPPGDTNPAPHLQGSSRGLDLNLSLRVNGAELATPRSRHLGWSAGQLIAHLTSNGSTLRPGDLLGSGTISGPEPHLSGSLLELTHDGTRPMATVDGSRGYLADGDRVTLAATASTPQGRIDLGDVEATVVPSG